VFTKFDHRPPTPHSFATAWTRRTPFASYGPRRTAEAFPFTAVFNQSFRATRLRFSYSRPAPHLPLHLHRVLHSALSCNTTLPHSIRPLPLSSRKQAATDHEPTARNSQQRFCLAYRRPPPPPHVALAGQLQHTHFITKFLVQSYLNAVHDEHLAYVAPGMIVRLDKTRSSYRKEKAIWWSKRQNASYPPPTTITRIPVQSRHR
jgi:hypothetical protein